MRAIKISAVCLRLCVPLLFVAGVVWAIVAGSNASIAGARSAATMHSIVIDRSTVRDAASDTSSGGLSLVDATVLGVVEGVTEYLPISSTGHLYVTEQLLGVGDTPAEKDAADSFAIVIQFGAILAVVLLYWQRIKSIFMGLIGKDEQGRHLLVCLILAFGPAVVIALLFEDLIKEHLFGGWPIAVAWAVGGVVILALKQRFTDHERSGTSITDMTYRTALIIGVAQSLALWPGTSRSLVTILAAVLMGMSLSGAVEFSFLLGLVTLGAATSFEALKSGGEIISTFGVAMPVVSVIVAAVTAAVAVKWMVTYLERHSFAIFGVYRLAAASALALMLITNVVSS